MTFLHRGTARVFARSFSLQWGALISHSGRFRHAENNPFLDQGFKSSLIQRRLAQLAQFSECVWNVWSKWSKARLWYCRICLFIVLVMPGRSKHKYMWLIDVCYRMYRDWIAAIRYRDGQRTNVGVFIAWSPAVPMVWTVVAPLGAAVLWQYILNENNIYYWKSSEETVRTWVWDADTFFLRMGLEEALRFTCNLVLKWQWLS